MLDWQIAKDLKGEQRQLQHGAGRFVGDVHVIGSVWAMWNSFRAAQLPGILNPGMVQQTFACPS